MFKNAIVRTPAASLSNGLTTVNLGKPNYELALLQHQNYSNALRACGVEVTVLPALEQFPDSCFVEDVALLTERTAILTLPGAPSRQGEVQQIQSIIRSFYHEKIQTIISPGCIEAGDILQVDQHFFIGLSERTNNEGAAQMIRVLQDHGYTAATINLDVFLHLKTGISYLDHNTVLVSGELINHPALDSLKHIVVDDDESYAANCIMVNGTVLLPQGFPKTKAIIGALGLSVIELDMSEFRKVDGGLSCLSLRF